jgi:large subunit ribosomal protein L4
VPRDYSQRTPKKMKAAALRGALSDRARNDRVHVVSSLLAGDVPSTKDAAAALAKVSGAKNVLVVVERTDELTWLSLRNLTNVHVLEPGQLNTYDVLISDDVVFTQGALEAFIAGPAKGRTAKGAATSDELVEATIAADDDAAVVSTEKKPAKKAAAKKAAPKAEEPADGNAAVAELSSSDASDAAAAAEEDES